MDYEWDSGALAMKEMYKAEDRPALSLSVICRHYLPYQRFHRMRYDVWFGSKYPYGESSGVGVEVWEIRHPRQCWQLLRYHLCGRHLPILQVTGIVRGGHDADDGCARRNSVLQMYSAHPLRQHPAKQERKIDDGGEMLG